MQGADLKPISPEQRVLMERVLTVIDEAFNGAGTRPEDKKFGFFLTMFEMNTPGRFNYISNSDKLDVHVMLKEITSRLEARLSEEGRA